MDNLIDNPGSKEGMPCMYAHLWCYGEQSIKSWGDGAPLAAVLGFLRRHLVSSTEPVMERPANAKEWEVFNAGP